MMSPDNPKLTAYVLKDLAESERAEVEAKLAASESLRNEIKEIESTALLIQKALKQELVPLLDAAHRNAIEDQLTRTEAGTRQVPWTRRYLRIARAAAIVIVTASVTLVALTGWKSHVHNNQRLAASALIERIHSALSRYQSDFGRLPPDTGYGLSPVDSSTGAGRTYDAGSLWHYLANVQRSGDKIYGPYVAFSAEELIAYKDPSCGDSFYVVDPWGTPIGYIGDKRRVIHNRGRFDIFSAGPDRKTAQDCADLHSGQNLAYDNVDNDGDGVVDNAEELGPAALNGCLTLANANIQTASVTLDDLNNWDPN